MKSSWRRRLAYTFAAAAVGVATGVLTTVPTGCASNCGNNCPITTAVIETDYDFDPGITGLAWTGPACNAGLIGCRGQSQNTTCNHINITADSPGFCDVLIEIYGREPTVVHLEFGDPSTVGCCKGYPVVGDWHFTIPFMKDAGIYGGDGNTGAVHPLDGGTMPEDGGADAPDDSSTDDGGTDAAVD